MPYRPPKSPFHAAYDRANVTTAVRGSGVSTLAMFW